ncbi:MAG: hypothetical protein M3019_11355 [Candidatus Dormibacteraeota bacterium]|nr:hypothetical protein [Candidatus Dormibacteraeota bacterium]
MAVPSSGSTTSYEFSATGQPLGLNQGNTNQQLFDDGHANVGTVVSTAASVACTARFDPFGTALALAGTVTPGTLPSSTCNTGTSSSTPNTYFYRSARQDPGTGDYQFGARLYDPGKDSFLVPDTSATGAPKQNPSVGSDPLLLNTYTYVNGDPVNLVDPTGHRPTECDSNSGCSGIYAGASKGTTGSAVIVSGPTGMSFITRLALQYGNREAQFLDLQLLAAEVRQILGAANSQFPVAIGVRSSGGGTDFVAAIKQMTTRDSLYARGRYEAAIKYLESQGVEVAQAAEPAVSDPMHAEEVLARAIEPGSLEGAVGTSPTCGARCSGAYEEAAGLPRGSLAPNIRGFLNASDGVTQVLKGARFPDVTVPPLDTGATGVGVEGGSPVDSTGGAGIEGLAGTLNIVSAVPWFIYMLRHPGYLPPMPIPSNEICSFNPNVPQCVS